MCSSMSFSYHFLYCCYVYSASFQIYLLFFSPYFCIPCRYYCFPFHVFVCSAHRLLIFLELSISNFSHVLCYIKLLSLCFLDFSYIIMSWISLSFQLILTNTVSCFFSFLCIKSAFVPLIMFHHSLILFLHIHVLLALAKKNSLGFISTLVAL